jgi:predicted amidohydrolase
MPCVKVAVSQYQIELLPNWQLFSDKLEAQIQDAVQQGAQLLVFPEYAGMELIGVLGLESLDLRLQLFYMQTGIPRYVQQFQTWANYYQVHIVSGSLPVQEGESIFNRCHIFTPNGSFLYYDKLMMTRFEAEDWIVSPGKSLQTVQADWGQFGVALCYDSEFPMLVRSMVEAGAALIVVPSCTDALAGYHRVHISCRARALENQCYVVQSCLVGNVDWLPAVDVNVGRSGIYTPVDRGFPSDGILAQGDWNRPGWIYADMDFDKIKQVRTEGQVFNYRDWPRALRLLDDAPSVRSESGV